MKEARFGGFEKGGDGGTCGVEGIKDRAVFLVEAGDEVGDGKRVEIERARVALLGVDVGSVWREGHGGEWGVGRRSGSL